MNINSIRVIPQINNTKHNKQNVAFGDFKCSLTKETFEQAVRAVNKKYYKIPEHSLKTETIDRFWGNIEKLKERFENNKMVDVSIHEEEDIIWAMASPGEKIKTPHNNYGKGEVMLEKDYIISGGENLTKTVNDYADKLEKKYSFLKQM